MLFFDFNLNTKICTLKAYDISKHNISLIEFKQYDNINVKKYKDHINIKFEVKKNDHIPFYSKNYIHINLSLFIITSFIELDIEIKSNHNFILSSNSNLAIFNYIFKKNNSAKFRTKTINSGITNIIGYYNKNKYHKIKDPIKFTSIEFICFKNVIETPYLNIIYQNNLDKNIKNKCNNIFKVLKYLFGDTKINIKCNLVFNCNKENISYTNTKYNNVKFTNKKLDLYEHIWHELTHVFTSDFNTYLSTKLLWFIEGLATFMGILFENIHNEKKLLIKLNKNLNFYSNHFFTFKLHDVMNEYYDLRDDNLYLSITPYLIGCSYFTYLFIHFPKELFKIIKYISNNSRKLNINDIYKLFIFDKNFKRFIVTNKDPIIWNNQTFKITKTIEFPIKFLYPLKNKKIIITNDRNKKTIVFNKIKFSNKKLKIYYNNYKNILYIDKVNNKRNLPIIILKDIQNSLNYVKTKYKKLLLKSKL